MANLNKDILLGTAIGDALGVPVEFEHRQELGKNHCVKDTIYVQLETTS